MTDPRTPEPPAAVAPSTAAPSTPVSAVPAEAVPATLRPGALWWLLAISSIPVGIYAVALQDARSVSDAVPGLPWLDEVHFAAGGLTLLVGPFAFRRDLLVRASAWHRRLGWLYVAGVFCSGGAALAMACFSTGGITTHLGFGLLGVLWLTATALGVRAITAARPAVASHRRWMVVSFALAYAAVTLRLQLGPLSMAFGAFEPAYRVVSWLCWLPNLLFAWWWLRHTTTAGRWRTR